MANEQIEVKDDVTRENVLAACKCYKDTHKMERRTKALEFTWPNRNE